MTTEYIESSTGPIVLGEWNRNLTQGLALADSKRIPMVVFYGGLSCGVCEMLQLACLTDEFKEWQARKKVVMIFTTDNTRGNANRFAKPENESGLPYIAAYWNRDGVAPEKYSKNYMCFRGKDGEMPAKTGSLASQLMRSLDLVMGEYPYGGGDFLLTAGGGASARLEVEAGYAADTTVAVPLTRSGESAYENRLVCGGMTNIVAWAAGEKGQKIVRVKIPNGLSAGAVISLQLLASTGDVHAMSEIAVVESQTNSVRNPAWLGEYFAAGEWTMDLEAALSRAKDGEFKHVLVYFTGALWCPHCQGLEEGVLSKDVFKKWCVDQSIALVELDNPRRSDATTPANDYTIKTASGEPPTLLRYVTGQNSYAGRTESGASYLSRKGIEVGNASTRGTAEWVLQRNRQLGYAWGEGTYCAPDAGRCGYPTLVLLNADGSIAGRFNRLEGDSYAHDATENMARFEELLKLADGAGETANYSATTSRTLSPGDAPVSVALQVNDRTECFKLAGLPTGRVSFAVTGAPADRPVTLSVLRRVDGAETVVASGTGALTSAFSGETDLFLKVDSFGDARAYGKDSGFEVAVASSLVLVPVEKSAVFAPNGRSFKLAVEKGVCYRLEGFATPEASAFRDDGAAVDGGRLYTALATGECALETAAATVEYQIWKPGTVAFDVLDATAFTFQGSLQVSVTRSGGSSGAASVGVKVAGGDAVNGERYVWDDATVFAWADGESGTKTAMLRLIDSSTELPNATCVLKLSRADGSAAVSTDAFTVTICTTDKPVLPKTSYSVPLFATLDASAALDGQKVFNVTEGKVALKKVDGKLPQGVKLVYEDGYVKLSGVAKKPGNYTYTFTLQQRQSSGTMTGPEITLAFTVAAASDVAKGGNSWLGQKSQATLPLYLDENGMQTLKGILEFKMTAQNKITAKYFGLSKKAVSFKGIWGTMEDGIAETETLTAKTGQSLRLVLDAGGRISAELDDPAYATVLTTNGGLQLGIGNYAAAFSGAYTASLIETSSGDPAGHGYFVIKSVTAAGKASWKGVLANGQAISGYAYLSLDDDGCAVLPVFKYRPKDWIAAPVRLRANASQLDYPRAIKGCPGTVSRWAHYVEPASVHECEVRGSLYDNGRPLDSCCYQQFFQTNLLLSAVLDGFKSGKFGAATDAAQGKVIVRSQSLELAERLSDLKLTFAKRTGIFKGTMTVMCANGKAKATFQGVVLPGWHDCGCERPSPDDPFSIDVSQPFALGAAWISDAIGGTTVKRGFSVKIDENQE